MQRSVFPRDDLEKSHYNSSMGLLSSPPFQLQCETLVRNLRVNEIFGFIDFYRILKKMALNSGDR